MAPSKEPKRKIVAENRKARHNYFIEAEVEVGIMLEGSEVKALREGHAQIAESYANVESGELWLINSYIPSYDKARTFGHDERRRRKLLAHRKEIAKFWQGIGREGATLVPLKLYFNEKGVAKLSLGIAKGKKMSDKRETEKKRDWARDKARLLRERG
ncbi:SsrA-binding protein SmpB [Pikeienuella piscinae]|uniref:SsrA-binding protein n=1 Tax=Pikeienuella piscinae TaxID=2748098 RepID=A0A7M3T568_9RHOB|nr:SsrA-binding protein SmpB [Pikeienuella piscinae]QIE57149.1 SsrA-binding protein SmpB [Pikeienuella piscinae]